VVCGTPLAAAASSPVLSGELRSPPPPPPLSSGLPPPPPVPSGLPPAAGFAAAAAGSPIALEAGPTARPSIPRSPSGSHDPVGARSLELPLDAPRILVGFLVSFENLELGQYWPIHQGRNVVGRQGAATGIQVEIAHPTTSSLHAVLIGIARPGRILVEDNNSTNGTFVNDNPLVAGQRWELRDGDRVRFGLFNAVVKVIESNYPLPGGAAAPG
jgi:hypothetical protein